MEESTTTPTDDVRSTLWAWVAVLFIILSTLVGLVGAILLTPGSPSSCNMYTRAGWFLCDWARGFVANAIIMAVVIFGTTVPLALVIGFTRAAVHAVRD
jgi:hypothetical protein